MKKAILLVSMIGAITLFQNPLFASVPTSESLEKLLKTMNSKANYIEQMRKINSGLSKQIIDRNFPEKVASGSREERYRNELESALEKSLNEAFDVDSHMKDLAAIYQSHFNEQEVQDLIKFYQSPTGAKAAGIINEIVNENSEASQKRITVAMEKWRVKAEAIRQKYVGK